MCGSCFLIAELLEHDDIANKKQNSGFKRFKHQRSDSFQNKPQGYSQTHLEEEMNVNSKIIIQTVRG